MKPWRGHLKFEKNFLDLECDFWYKLSGCQHRAEEEKGGSPFKIEKGIK